MYIVKEQDARGVTCPGGYPSPGWVGGGGVAPCPGVPLGRNLLPVTGVHYRRDLGPVTRIPPRKGPGTSGSKYYGVEMGYPPPPPPPGCELTN